MSKENVQLQEQIKYLIKENRELKKKTKYGLNWEDKPETLDNNDVVPLFKKNEELSLPHVDNQPENYLIEGDNYHSLKALQHTHREKVDVIYIDPPYNTGNTDFVYNDKYVDADDGFRHSKWLSFMDKRLRVAKELLSNDGVIFVSIDDNEFAQLKLLMDKIFGEANRITTFTWLNTNAETITDETKYAGSNIGRMKTSHEYVLAYKKYNFKMAPDAPRSPYIDKLITNGQNNINTLNIPKGLKTLEPITKTITGRVGGNRDYYEILNPEGMIIVNGELINDVSIKGPLRNHNMLEKFFDGRTVIDNKGQKLIDVYISNSGMLHTRKLRLGDTPASILSGKGTTKEGTAQLADIFGQSPFSYAKPVKLIKYLISKHYNKDAVVLDFFAGSGTTGHAVMELNAEDGGKRSFILCTNNEVSPEQERNYLANNTDF